MELQYGEAVSNVWFEAQFAISNHAFFKGCCKRNTDAAGLVSVGGSSLKT